MTSHLDLIRHQIQQTKAYKIIARNLNYHPAQGYCDAKDIAMSLASQIVTTKQYLDGGLPQNQRHSI